MFFEWNFIRQYRQIKSMKRIWAKPGRKGKLQYHSLLSFLLKWQNAIDCWRHSFRLLYFFKNFKSLKIKNIEKAILFFYGYIEYFVKNESFLNSVNPNFHLNFLYDKFSLETCPVPGRTKLLCLEPGMFLNQTYHKIYQITGKLISLLNFNVNLSRLV